MFAIQQSWTNDRAVTCIQSRQMRHGHHVALQDPKQILCLSAEMETCLSPLKVMEQGDMHSALAQLETERVDWLMLAVRRREERAHASFHAFFHSIFSNRENTLMQRSFDFPICRHDSPNFRPWVIYKVWSICYTVSSVEAPAIKFWAQDHRTAFTVKKYLDGYWALCSCEYHWIAPKIFHCNNLLNTSMVIWMFKINDVTFNKILKCCLVWELNDIPELWCPIA